MGLPAGYPAADASFNSHAFWELNPDGKAYAGYAPEEEHVIVGQVVVTRYTKPVSIQIMGLAGTTDAANLEGDVGGSHTLDWHRTNVTALLVKIESKRIPHLAVVELVMDFII